MAAGKALLTQHFQNADQQAFRKTLANIAPGLESYVSAQLRLARANGLIPTDLYTADDILDEVSLRMYENFATMPEDESALRVKLFQLAHAVLDKMIQREAWQQDSIRLEDILADEIRSLNEISHITRDADGDIVMVEDLDDSEIEPPEPRAMLLEDSFEDEVIQQIKLNRASIQSDDRQRRALADIYHQLPAQSRIILDLWARGKLSIAEIASVRGISVEQVEDILSQIQRRFQSIHAV